MGCAWASGSAVARARVARSPAELLRIVGRVALWCLLLVLLVRGLSDVLATRDPLPVATAPAATASVWPGDDARALAVQFTRAYLGYVPREGEDTAAELQAFVTPELANAIVPVASGSGRPPEVRDAVVARAVRVNDRRALITVAATVAGSSAARLLTVPVARDAGGRPGGVRPAVVRGAAAARAVAGTGARSAAGRGARRDRGPAVALLPRVPGGPRRRARVSGPRGRRGSRRSRRRSSWSGVDALPAGRREPRAVGAGDGPGPRPCSRGELRAAVPGAAGARGPLVGGRSQVEPERGLSVLKVIVSLAVVGDRVVGRAGRRVGARRRRAGRREPRRPARRLGEEPVSGDRRGGGAGVPAQPAVRRSGGVHGGRAGGGRVRDGAERHRRDGARHLADDHGAEGDGRA